MNNYDIFQINGSRVVFNIAFKQIAKATMSW